MAKLPFKTEKLAALAPMAGVTDSAFRLLCREQGALFCVSEMVSVKALAMGDRKTPLLMNFSEAERPFGIQLFGTDPADFAAAAAHAEQTLAPDFIDINMGCPTPKITSGGAGSALMKTPERAVAIVRTVRGAVSLPVSVKLRAGYSETTAPALAPLLEQAGADWITIHGRTRDRMYAPPVDLEVIREIKRRVSVPVIGNGDIYTSEDALHMLEITGCDAVMIGRGALGNPFIFARVNAALRGLTPPALPSASERMATLRRQAVLMVAQKGEAIALRELRRHAAWYTRGLRGAAAARAKACGLSTLDDLEAFIDYVIKQQAE